MNRFPFAPGAVSYARRGWLGTRAQRRELLRWLRASAAFLVVVGVCFLAAGYLMGATQ